MKLIIWFAKNPVAANLLMLLIIAGGLHSLSVAKRYVFPPELKHQLLIEIAYDGASPGEVEQALCIPIEEAIHDLEGLQHINSTASQALCRVIVEFDPNVDSARFQAAVQARLDVITVFPKEAEKLTVKELKSGILAIIVVLRGEADTHILQRYRDRLQARLSAHPDIGLLSPFPELPFEISIEISELDLRRYKLSFEEIAALIRQSSKNIPAGELKNKDGKLLLKSNQQAMNIDDYAAIELRHTNHGASLLLGDIAQITETVREQDLLVKSDGKQAMEIFVWPKHQIGKTVAAVDEVIAIFKPELPSDIEVITWDDWSKYYEQSMSMLLNNAILGFILIFIILTLTLQTHIAFWVSSGILISILGAFWFIPILDISLNTYTIAALILILGVVVDDAIIVGERIYTHQEHGNPGLSGAIKGIAEISPLVVLMVLSTMIAFVPGLFLPGFTGHLMYNVSVVILLALAFSMLEVLLILPAHLAGEKVLVKQTSFISSIQAQVTTGLQWLINSIYVPMLQTAVHLRYIVCAGFIVLLLIMSALVLSNRIPSVIDAPVDDYYLHTTLTLPVGTSFDEVNQQISRLEDIANEIRAELNIELEMDSSLENNDSIRHVLTLINDNWGFINLEIAIDERVRDRMGQIVKQWQERFGELPANTTLTFQTVWPRDFGLSAENHSKAIELVLTAADTAQQSAAGEILKDKLAAYNGVHSVASSMQAGKTELRLKLKPMAAAYGLTMHSLGEQVRHSFLGLEVQRFFQNQDEIRVMLRLAYADRLTLDNLYDLPIKLGNGEQIPFSMLAKAEYAAGFAQVTRQDRERIQLVSAEVYSDVTNVETILSDLNTGVIPQLEAQFPGLEIKPGQSRQQQEKAMFELWFYGALALFGIYTLLAIPLRSYTQPLVIMLAIPFGFIGAVIGHLLLKIPLSLESYVALFAVGGIVINDSLILITQINKNLQQKIPLYKATVLASKSRFRAIFLTTITTFVGLMPLISAQGYDAEKIMPMAVTIAFGVLFSFFVTLFLVPTSYVILKGGVKKRCCQVNLASGTR